jgi:hypothetical protein
VTERTPPRAEVVGSLLRPPALRAAIEAFYEPGHSAALDEERAKDRAALRAAEDDAIREAVRRQRDRGLDVITDGEVRRWMFMNSFYDAVSGVRTGKTVTFRNDRDEHVELAVHEIVAPLEVVDSPAAREAAFLREVAGGTSFKVTFPAASIFAHPFTTVDGAYESVDAFVDHAVAIERELVADAIDAGARYVQFDLPSRYPVPRRATRRSGCRASARRAPPSERSCMTGSPSPTTRHRPSTWSAAGRSRRLVAGAWSRRRPRRSPGSIGRSGAPRGNASSEWSNATRSTPSSCSPSRAPGATPLGSRRS